MALNYYDILEYFFLKKETKLKKRLFNPMKAKFTCN